jgi:hypothetical protein
MRRILQIVLLLVFSLGLAQENQEIYQRAQINYNSIEDLSALASLGIAVDHGVHKRGFFIISDFSKSEIAAAQNAGFLVDIIREDSKAYFLEQNRINAPAQNNPTCPGSSFIDYETPVNFQLGSMGGYLTYQEMLDNLDLMQSLYPDLISEKENIGSFFNERPSR